MPSVRVDLGPRAYDIVIGSGADSFPAFLSAISPGTPFAVADANTAGIARGLGLVDPVVVPSGESTKSLILYESLLTQLAERAADRRTPVVAVGGGVVGDLAGFAAATYNRGLPLVMVPTTLLAMVDSSVGGKVGINLPAGKNLVGAFHQPAGVWIDLAHLDTLPDREFRSGLAEVVKYGVILDAAFFEWLETSADAILARDPAVLSRVVETCCRLKADVVEKDEREETGLRMVLNYGHTFAHAFESVGGYGAWLHGEAVAAGMVAESRLAERLGLIESTLTDRQVQLLTRFGLPTERVRDWPTDALIEAMRRDKKNRAGRLRFILPTRLGEVRVHDGVPESLVRETLA